MGYFAKKMKIRLFTIPNMLTLGNLLCGASAVVALLMHSNFELAFWLVVASAIFDFFDGFAARLLKSTSAIGVELDSLADMVSFGLVPAVAMFCIWDFAPASETLPEWMRYLTLIIVAFSALRLAKFNIDDTQTSEFCGLPTPANGLFCLSIAMLMAAGEISIPRWAIIAISIGMAYMLISPIRMFALKFKGFGWQGNEIRYSFIALCIAIIAAFTRYSIPTIILLYIIISAIRWAINSHKK